MVESNTGTTGLGGPGMGGIGGPEDGQSLSAREQMCEDSVDMLIVKASGCERAATDIGEGGGLRGTTVGLVWGTALEETSVAEESSLINAGV
jgi:hypothetical protein